MLPVGYIILNKEIVESFRFPWFVYVVCSGYRLLPQVVKYKRGVFSKIGSHRGVSLVGLSARPMCVSYAVFLYVTPTGGEQRTG